MTYRILITGSRTWTYKGRLWDSIDHAVDQSGYELRDVVIIHGAAPRGADAMADEWAHEYAVKTEPHPADWAVHGRRAGFIRNAHMVALGADLCLAFIAPCTDRRCHQPGTHGTHGAIHCVNAAERAGIPTWKYTP